MVEIWGNIRISDFRVHNWTATLCMWFPVSLFKNRLICCVWCVWVRIYLLCMMYECADHSTHVEGRGQLLWSQFFPFHLNSWDWTQVIRFAQQAPLPMESSQWLLFSHVKMSCLPSYYPYVFIKEAGKHFAGFTR